MNCDEDDASSVTAPPRTDDRERPSATVVQRHPQGAQRVEDGTHRADPSLRVAVELDPAVRERGRRRQEPHDGAGQPDIDVHATAQGLGGPDHPVGDAGHLVHRHTRAVVALRGGVLDLDTERAQPGRHQQGVARAQRLPESGPVASQGGQDEEPVGEGLAAGQGHRRLDRTAGGGGGPVAGMAGVPGGGPGGGGHGCSAPVS